MKPSRSFWIRTLSLCLLLVLLISPVLPASAAPLGDLITVSESVEIPPEVTEGDLEKLSNIYFGLFHMYMTFYESDNGLEFPAYFAGFGMTPDLLPVIYLTEISDEILEEIRTALYSYRAKRATEKENIQYMDKWFPTISYQLVEYSYNELCALDDELRDVLRDEKQRDFITQVDCDNNQIILFYETQSQVDQALALTNDYPSILQAMPIEQFDAWAEERSAPPATQTAEPVEPSAETAGKVMPGMKNTFYTGRALLCKN